MRTLALAAAALLGTATLAAAQPAPPAPPPAPPAPGAAQPGPGPDDMHHGMHDHDGGHRMMMGMSRPRGARFIFERQGALIDLRCADNEPTRACVDAASVLIDKLAPQTPRQ